MRTFIAVEIPKEAQQSINKYIISLKDSLRDLKWVAPDNLHLTLKFLGEVQESDIKKLSGSIQKTVSGSKQFSIVLSHTGFFPPGKHPRVIWIGADGGADNLLELFQELEHYLEDAGFDREEKTFSPHLTIGRVKRDKKILIPDTLPEFVPVEFVVKSVVLFKSTLTSQGPVYEKLFEGELCNY
jgi:2'-5' RNA ligase